MIDLLLKYSILIAAFLLSLVVSTFLIRYSIPYLQKHGRKKGEQGQPMASRPVWYHDSGFWIGFFEIIVIFSFIIFSIAAPTAYGQDTLPLFRFGQTDLLDSNFSANTEITSASRSQTYLEELPVTAYIITREDILNNGYTSLVDVLKSVPGVKVSQPGSAIEGETFLMRGLFGNYYAQILIDDIPVQPSVVSGMPLAEQLPIRQAERIEVIVGPAAAVYGADAVAGVINIITHRSDRPVFVNADIAASFQRYGYLNVLIGGRSGKGKNIFEYQIFGSFSDKEDTRVKYTDGDVYNPAKYDTSYAFLHYPYYKGDSSEPKFGRLPETSSMLGLNLRFKGFRYQFIKSYRAHHSSIGKIPVDFTYYDAGNLWCENINRHDLSYRYAVRNFSSSTNLSYLIYRMDDQSSLGFTVDAGLGGRGYLFAASDDLFLEEIVNFQPISWLEFTGGFSLKYSSNLPRTNFSAQPFDEDKYEPFRPGIKPEPDSIFGYFGFNPVNYSNTGLFLQASFNHKSMNLIAGLRYDYHSEFGPTFSPRVALLVSPGNKISFRLSAGTAFRVPSTYFIYNSAAFNTGNGISYNTVPNLSLKPEQLFSAEAGLRFDPSGPVSLDASVYYHVLNEQFTRTLFPLDSNLYPNSANVGNIAWAFVNDENSEAKLLGLQVNAHGENLVPSIKLNVDLFLSIAKGKEVLPYSLGNLDDYRQMPVFLGQLNLSLYPFDRLYLNIRNVLSTQTAKRFFPLSPSDMERLGLPTYVSGYYTMDILARLKINRNFDVFAQVYNVFNEKYGGIDAYGNETDLIFNPQYERLTRIGLSFRLD